MKRTDTETIRWLNRPHALVAEGIETVAFAPRGALFKLVLLGIALPLVILYFAHGMWESEKATWFGRQQDILVYGATAKALATSYFGAALFCNARCYWGLVPVPWMHSLCTIAGLSMVVGGIGYGAYTLLLF